MHEPRCYYPTYDVAGIGQDTSKECDERLFTLNREGSVFTSYSCGVHLIPLLDLVAEANAHVRVVLIRNKFGKWV